MSGTGTRLQLVLKILNLQLVCISKVRLGTRYAHCIVKLQLSIISSCIFFSLPLATGPEDETQDGYNMIRPSMCGCKTCVHVIGNASVFFSNVVILILSTHCVAQRFCLTLELRLCDSSLAAL